jgi:hypothetical protein
MAYYPTGKWYRSYIEKYEENVFKKFEEDIMAGKITESKNIQLKLEEIIDALRNAIEKGNDLHLGIVIGQTLKQLEDIAYK